MFSLIITRPSHFFLTLLLGKIPAPQLFPLLVMLQLFLNIFHVKTMHMIHDFAPVNNTFLRLVHLIWLRDASFLISSNILTTTNIVVTHVRCRIWNSFHNIIKTLSIQRCGNCLSSSPLSITLLIEGVSQNHWHHFTSAMTQLVLILVFRSSFFHSTEIHFRQSSDLLLI